MRRRPLGHNLLEMIIACFIFSTVAIGLTTVWIQHSRTMERAGGRMVGQFLANEIMEECIAAGYDKVDALVGARPDMVMKEVVRDAPKAVTYTATVEVSPATTPDGLAIKVVKVTVYWDEQSFSTTARTDAAGRDVMLKGSVDYQCQLAQSGGPAP
jgi:hypothetical protein